jgi:hypothetical protein
MEPKIFNGLEELKTARTPASEGPIAPNLMFGALAFQGSFEALGLAGLAGR